MKQVPDRKRLRREYVQRKRELWLELALGSVVLSVLKEELLRVAEE